MMVLVNNLTNNVTLHLNVHLEKRDVLMVLVKYSIWIVELQLHVVWHPLINVLIIHVDLIQVIVHQYNNVTY